MPSDRILYETSTFYCRPYSEERRLPFANTPLWLVDLLTVMLTANSTRLVGPILSCEREVHIQSWTQLIDWRVMDTVLPIMSATCEPGIDWDSVIDKEVAIGVSLLREGFSLAGLHPSCRVFSLEDREKLHQQHTDTLRELSWCKNILRADVSNFLTRLMILPRAISRAMRIDTFLSFYSNIWNSGSERAWNFSKIRGAASSWRAPPRCGCPGWKGRADVRARTKTGFESTIAYCRVLPLISRKEISINL